MDVSDVFSIRMPPTLAEYRIHHDVRHLLRPQMLYMSSGEAVFFSRQEWRKYLWIMEPMIVTNEVPQRQPGHSSDCA